MTELSVGHPTREDQIRRWLETLPASDAQRIRDLFEGLMRDLAFQRSTLQRQLASARGMTVIARRRVREGMDRLKRMRTAFLNSAGGVFRKEYTRLEELEKTGTLRLTPQMRGDALARIALLNTFDSIKTATGINIEHVFNRSRQSIDDGDRSGTGIRGLGSAALRTHPEHQKARST